ncbi:MAG: methylenetetrahydrofolate reductase, partial [Acetatifactor sp.]|nr:methylenetetrahydrofolate reductase [Acetatifactor sp.]
MILPNEFMYNVKELSMITSDTKKKYDLSFEVFPPKKDGEFDKAFQILDELAALNPEFISVTYGAGGSQSKKTTEIASYIQNQLH